MIVAFLFISLLFTVGFVMWPALLLVVVFGICFCIIVCLWYVFCVLSAASIVGIVCSRCRAGVDATP